MSREPISVPARLAGLSSRRPRTPPRRERSHVFPYGRRFEQAFEVGSARPVLSGSARDQSRLFSNRQSGLAGRTRLRRSLFRCYMDF